MKVLDTDNFKEELDSLSYTQFQGMEPEEIAETIAREIADSNLEDEYAIYKAEFYGNFTKEGYEETIPMTNEFQDIVGYGIIRVPYDMMMRAILNHLGIEHEQIEEIKYDSERNVTIISYVE